jgi:hypothetical protein
MKAPRVPSSWSTAAEKKTLPAPATARADDGAPGTERPGRGRAVTDRIGLEKLGFPVFCAGFSPVTTLCTGTNGEVQIPSSAAAPLSTRAISFSGTADGVIVLPDDYEHLLEGAERLTQNEIRRMERVAKEGYRFLQRDDVDIVKFFEYDKEAFINELKKECIYLILDTDSTRQ